MGAFLASGGSYVRGQQPVFGRSRDSSGDPATVLSQASLLQEIADNRKMQIAVYLDDAGQLTAKQRAEVAAQSIGGAAPSTTSRPTAAKTPAATSSPKPTPSATASPSASASASTTSAGEEAVAFAKAQIGKPYARGATGPDAYDCSGLVRAAWASAGVSIPRDTYKQWAAMPHIAETSL